MCNSWVLKLRQNNPSVSLFGCQRPLHKGAFRSSTLYKKLSALLPQMVCADSCYVVRYSSTKGIPLWWMGFPIDAVKRKCPKTQGFSGTRKPYSCYRVNSNILKKANFLILSHTFISHLFCFAARSFSFLIFSCFFLIHSWYRAALHDK